MSILATQLNFLQRASVDAAVVHEVDRHSRSFSRRSNLALQRDWLVWAHLGDGSHFGRAPVFIVKSCNEVPRKENSEGSRQLDFSILCSSRLQWSNQDPRVRDAVELLSRTRGKPLWLK